MGTDDRLRRRRCSRVGGALEDGARRPGSGCNAAPTPTTDHRPRRRSRSPIHPTEAVPMTLTDPRRLLAGICLAVAAWTAAHPAHAAPAPPAVPEEITVPDGYKPFLVGHAAGDQIYTCTTIDGGFTWSAAVPRA